jgi:general stress protein YciG
MNADTTGTHPQTTNEGELTADPPPRPLEQGEAQAPRPKRPRGFAAMDRRLVSEIARKGGKAAHTAGTAHEFTSDEARAAGSKGGRATHARRRKATAEQQG